MVKHIVLWKIRDDDRKQQNIDQMIDMLTSLVGKVEGLVSMEMGYNFNTGSDYDVVLYAAFKNSAALKYYQNHPEHLKCKDFIGSISVGRTAADYFFEEGKIVARPFDEVPDAPENNDLHAAVQAAMKMSEGTPPKISVPDLSEQTPVKDDLQEAVKEAMKMSEGTPPKISVPDIPAAPIAPPPAPVPVAPAAPPPAPVPVAPAAPKSKRVETITEKKDIFGKKKLDVQVTPLEQRSDTWTCPVCGKVMPNYVGTCGCGEPKPFEFDEVPPALQPAPTAKPAAAPAAPSAPAAPKSKRVETITEKKDIFGKKKLDAQVTPLEQRSDTWTCPVCGKVMPNYVGTCGCGEPKPFAFDDVPAMQSAPAPKPAPTPAPTRNRMPKIQAVEEEEVAPIDTSEFTQAGPSIDSYSPQTAKPEDKLPDPKLNYIKNDNDPRRNSPKPFGKTNTSDAVSMSDAPVSMNFDNVPPPAPMRFSDTTDFNFDDAPPPAPMRFSDTPNFNFDDAPPPAPMRFNDAPPASPMKYEDTSKTAPKAEKKHLFNTKKSKEADAMRRAEEVVHNRKDVPNDGTWTCPNCGKVMPKYVGTCGCGESQPFEFC